MHSTLQRVWITVWLRNVKKGVEKEWFGVFRADNYSAKWSANLNYQIKLVRHGHLLFPSRPNLKIRIRVIRSIYSIAFTQIYTFWPALKLQTVHGRNVTSQGKAEIGSSSVLVVSLYKYQVKTRILNKFVGYKYRTTDVGSSIDISLVCRVGIHFWACKYEF